jgi:hypothetical protein
MRAQTKYPLGSSGFVTDNPTKTCQPQSRLFVESVRFTNGADLETKMRATDSSKVCFVLCRRGVNTRQYGQRLSQPLFPNRDFAEPTDLVRTVSNLDRVCG